MKKHFVVFLSPGTFVSEETRVKVKSWNIEEAVKLSRKIVERHNATPYGFYFITRARSNTELDSKTVKKSGIYYLGGEIRTLKDVKKENNPTNKILISNMEINNYKKVITNINSWAITLPFYKEDKVIKYTKE